MTTENLTEIFSLFGKGIIFGLILSGFPFIVGYFINSVFNELTE